MEHPERRRRIPAAGKGHEKSGVSECIGKTESDLTTKKLPHELSVLSGGFVCPLLMA